MRETQTRPVEAGLRPSPKGADPPCPDPPFLAGLPLSWSSSLSPFPSPPLIVPEAPVLRSARSGSGWLLNGARWGAALIRTAAPCKLRRGHPKPPPILKPTRTWGARLIPMASPVLGTPNSQNSGPAATELRSALTPRTGGQARASPSEGELQRDVPALRWQPLAWRLDRRDPEPRVHPAGYPGP